ncbi:unnamed protein product [Mucor hiemalis]
MTAATSTMPALDNQAVAGTEKKAKKPIRQAVGGLVVDAASKKVLMLSSRKAEGAFRLPRGNCEENESPEDAVVRVLQQEAGIQVDKTAVRVGTYTEANKKGKIVGHHWMYEVNDYTLLDSWPALDRNRVWVSLIS